MKILWAILLCVGNLAAASTPKEPVKTDLFHGGEGGYKTYRIPALVVTVKGTLLAFCAARKDFSDWAEINIAMRRSTNGGKTWEPARIIAAQGESTVDNPTPIVDKNGTIHFLYQVNYAHVYYIRSDDDGKTFTPPVDLTPVVDKFHSEWNWIVVAPGPGHAIQLKSGRLLVPVWMSTSHTHRPSIVSTIYSDDHGKTWDRGAVVPTVFRDPGEGVATELADGRVMLNIRNENIEHRRAIAFSPDGISGWTKPVLQDELYEPVCFASSVRYHGKGGRCPNCVLFANPYNQSTTAIIPQYEMRPRDNLTVRLSCDSGKTWPILKLLESGRTGYNDLAVGKDGSIYCLYEHGVPADNPLANANLCIAHFSLEWLTGGKGCSEAQ